MTDISTERRDHKKSLSENGTRICSEQDLSKWWSSLTAPSSDTVDAAQALPNTRAPWEAEKAALSFIYSDKDNGFLQIGHSGFPHLLIDSMQVGENGNFVSVRVSRDWENTFSIQMFPVEVASLTSFREIFALFVGIPAKQDASEGDDATVA